MARTERVLALDIGATTIKAGELEYSPGGVITLTGFAVCEYAEELSEANFGATIATHVRAMIQKHRFTARKALVSISGQSALMRFFPLPPVAEGKKRIRQIIEFEARQNMPFPLEEGVWDYQLIDNPGTSEREVLLVIIKSDVIEQVTSTLQALRLTPMIVDAAPVACYNAARANRVGDDNQCAMILNMGGRNCNLLFVDGPRVFSRMIPIAGFAITQQIAKELKIGLAEAEELKRTHGFVALGGPYEDPKSEVAATISKLVRGVMTRIHGEINRTISVYRAQQKGRKPVKLYLAGGGSIIPFTDRFFNETLDLEVTYLNPFHVVAIGETVDRVALQKAAHMFSEIVGLALRYRVQCPIEVSLIPQSIRKQQVFNARKPYLVGAIGALPLMAGLGLFGDQWLADQYRSLYGDFEASARQLRKTQRVIETEGSKAEVAQRKYAKMQTLLEQRGWWPALLNELQRAKPEGMWFTRVRPLYGEVKELGATGGAPGVSDDAADGTRTKNGQFKITGLELQGHSVASHRSPEADDSDPDANLSGVGGKENAWAPSRADEGSPELRFINELQASELCDGDPRFTGIVIYTPSETIGNLNSFIMQVKFKQPIEVTRE